MEKTRNDIAEEFKWDLTLIYKTEEDFNKDLEIAKKEVEKVKEYEGHILDDSNSLLNYLRYSDNTERMMYKLYYYANLNSDADTTNTHYQELLGKVQNLIQKYSINSSFVTPELMKQDYNKVLKFIEENKDLKEYSFALEQIYKGKEHTLSEVEEKLLSTLSNAFISEDAFEKLTDADMEFPDLNVNGKILPFNESLYGVYMRDPDRKVRLQALKTLLETYAKYKNTIATTFQGNVALLAASAKIHKFNSSLEASLDNDNLKPEIYNNLIDTINENLKTVQKYYDLIKEELKLDDFHFYDVYVPMVKDIDKDYTFEEAKAMLFEALKPLGDQYLKDLEKAFTERWIDIYHNKGKRGGAYSSGFYDTKPYVLLNFEGKFDDVSTLFHELGHSMHSYYSRSNNTYVNSSYNIFVAEVASTVNELFLIRYLLNKSTDKEEKKYLLNHLMILYATTVYRQVMFAEFERDMHKAYEDGEILTHEFLEKNYLELVKKYFGPNVTIDDYMKYEWTRIPHFYYNFYVYKYAIGLSCATKIVNDILNNKENALENYLAFLKTGGSMYPADELKVAGVDVFSKEVYEEAIKSFDDAIEEYKKLTK